VVLLSRSFRIIFVQTGLLSDPIFPVSILTSRTQHKIQQTNSKFKTDCHLHCLLRTVTAYGMVWYGMVNVDLYSAIITIVSNAPNTPVSREKPGFQALSKGLIVLLCATTARRSSGKEFQTMGLCTANARRPTVDSRCRGTTISWLCG